ncbi:MAG: UPF0280 family protein [Methanothrix sp.]|jgi:hypothetical protein|uniref:UPF0280 protein Mthe_1297 n=1 Tax=Methanothrix thermoacetophila (strain DSM 6194 / JCM 14653 / NBRC 101360 / PT) TaxID=349307 RepID=Y1297_METTP|nr:MULTISPECIES: UPF0280 family protein [Methanothrix]A0B8Q1.1 RecName: Full=UPF0280 protein Mthe_1297 [Methanothrix thermoacetophila PT]ABK15075.1 protein of unknown function DUF375 [Methanothrix thermoacetophila PT]MBC7079343.1 UPF0280 family protein [Methanothrix sp.]NPU86809.1 UPF0280 family protein [Methanothrix sp.]
MIREYFRLHQTIATIVARSQEHIEIAKSAIIDSRTQLEEFIAFDPLFQLTLVPYDLPVDNAPPIVKRMCHASSLFHVGPMAAVAGAIAAFAVEAMVEAGADYAVVDNGGDIAIFSDEPLLVGIYAGSSPIKNLALEIHPTGGILGVCSSSGTIGPSISFGCADVATVISRDPAIADAGATALGNAVTPDASLKECFSVVDRDEVIGALIIRGDEMAVWGEVPPIRRARVKYDLITKG